MHLFAEEKLLNAIGRFSTTAPLFRDTQGFNYHETLQRNSQNVISSTMVPGQCQAFLNSNMEQIWFIEEYSVEGDKLTNKKLYPAKVTGLGLPLISAQPNPVTLRWRDGLVRWGNIQNYPGNNYDSQTKRTNWLTADLMVQLGGEGLAKRKQRSQIRAVHHRRRDWE